MRGPDLAVPPRMRQTLQKAIEVRIAVRQHVDVLAGREGGEMLLHGANLVEEAQRIERAEDRAQGVSGAW